MKTLKDRVITLKNGHWIRKAISQSAQLQCLLPIIHFMHSGQLIQVSL